ELKFSDRILLRVDPGPGVRPPFLLREASYNVYNSTVWFATGAAFAPVQAEADGATWRFGAAPGPARSVGVAAYLPRGRGMLALPNGAFEVGSLAAVGVSRNALGAVRVDEGLGLVSYRARFGGASVLDGPPGAVEDTVRAPESAVVSRLAAELDLAAKPPSERLAVVARFFATNFRYRTFQRGRPAGAAPLEDFLLRARAGHCEYFATATVGLLLGWRLYRRRRVGPGPAAAAAPPRAPQPGEDSEFYLIERELTRAGLGRRPAEAASAWLRRLREAGAPVAAAEALPGILALHYRYRFDPVGLGAGERAALRSRVEAWLDTHAATAGES